MQSSSSMKVSKENESSLATLLLGTLIACLVAMTIVGIIWAAPFSYFLTSVVYRKLVAGVRVADYR